MNIEQVLGQMQPRRKITGMLSAGLINAVNMDTGALGSDFSQGDRQNTFRQNTRTNRHGFAAGDAKRSTEGAKRW